MTIDEAMELYPEAIQFDETGITPENSLLRRKCTEHFRKPATSLSLTMFLAEVFKTLANEFVAISDTPTTLMERWRKLYNVHAASHEKHVPDWESLCVGWCLANGLNYDEAYGFYSAAIELDLY